MPPDLRVELYQTILRDLGYDIAIDAEHMKSQHKEDYADHAPHRYVAEWEVNP